jgi:hypothetical protein
MARAARLLVVGSAAQLLGQALLDLQGRDPRATGGEVLWIVSHLALVVGVVALTAGVLALVRPRRGRLVVLGRGVVLLGAGAAVTILLYDVALGVAVAAGGEVPVATGSGRFVLRALDTLDFALVAGLVLVLLAWVAGEGARLLAGCAAMTGLAVPALPGIETLAAGAVLAGFVTLAALAPRPTLGPRADRVAVVVSAGAFLAAAWVSVPRAALAVIVVVLLTRVVYCGRDRQLRRPRPLARRGRGT